MRMQISGTKRQKRRERKQNACCSTVQLLERLVLAARGRQLQGVTDLSSCRRKESDCSQQASLLSNSLQQRGDKCRGLLWPDAFAKGAYSPAVLTLPPVESWPPMPPLTVVQRAQKLNNCQCTRVLFTDKSRFSTRSDSQRVLIWRDIGTRFYTSNIKVRHPYGGPEVLVWGGIMLNGRTELHIFDRGSVMGDQYCEEVLLPHVRRFRGAIGPDFIFMDDNARPHWTLAVEELLESEDITRMDWPAYSPDLNPIHHPENTEQLKQMLIKVWALLPQEMLHQLVLSMRRRCEATIARPDHRDENAGWSTRRFAGQVDRLECAVRNSWGQWTREGTHAWKTGSGATRKTTRREDRRIVRQALVNPTVTRSTIRADVGVAIVPRTISRHLAEANLKSKCPFHALTLTPEHRQLRLQWCQARSMWNVTDWQKFVFSDESRFVLETDDNRVRVWRRPGERYNSPHNVLRHTARTAGVMVRGAIAYDSRSTLIAMRGTLTGQRYVDDILRNHVGPFLNGLPAAIFQQGNARPHTARVAQDFLRHFQALPSQTRSPNFSPAHHVWDQLKRQMPWCHSVHDSELAFQDLWAHLPQDNIRCLINSKPRRVAACIAA
ncbi:transposable element Tcb2 transposase [Trichonephila clavipes]|nr:transposable element Tcb2 transposase [Trichonephila clavipes]